MGHAGKTMTGLPAGRVDLDRDAVAVLRALAAARHPTSWATADVAHAPRRAASEGRIAAAVLFDDAEISGLVLAELRDTVDDEAREALARLTDPLSAALSNDRRLHTIERLRAAAEADNRALLSRLSRRSIVDGIVGEEAGLRLVMERVAQVAHTDVPVLILGETGSGKEVVARAIHERSSRREGPMVRVNCGAIPSELIDSELFGHEKGAFTGAIAAKQGWFERADGGTLLLDEVGELSLPAQVRLLRILQEGTLERVGGARTLHVDVRIVAATHRDLHQMVDDGTFREDLWYRLSVFPLRLPPLRERLEDLPQLVAHFAARAGTRLGGAPLVPTADDLALLASYPWPGNVRELGAVIERAAILGHGKRLETAAALGAVTRAPSTRASLAPGQPSASARETSYAAESAPDGAIDTLDEAMKKHIARALGATHGRIEGPRGTAAILGINPHTLRSRMRKLGLDWSQFRDRA
ncbi:MAG: sigma 54-interacting transcriptional regulator [Sandaracinaceae bacterium]|nr:sigma 54-interacting transcriptional regulator [Sandaracinaceae bacterium]